MKRILAFLMFPVLSLGQLEQKSEVDLLTDNYNKAVERSTVHLTNTYKTELQKLLEKYSKKGDVKEVEKITNLLKGFIKDENKIYSSLNKLIENKVWKTPYGSTFFFERDGQGYKLTGSDKSTFMWKFISDDMIEWTGRRISTDKIINNYIKIFKDGTAKIGPTKEDINVDFIQVK